MSTARVIDWDKARLQLSKASVSLADDPAHRHKVMRERAIRLASRSSKAKDDQIELLSFFVGDERMGIELRWLAEVLPFRGCTPLPGAPSPLLGVTSHEGEIYTIVDLGACTSVVTENIPPVTHVLLLRIPGARLGLRIHEIQSVERLPESKLVRAGDASAGVAGQGIKGVWPSISLTLLDPEIILRAFI